MIDVNSIFIREACKSHSLVYIYIFQRKNPILSTQLTFHHNAKLLQGQEIICSHDYEVAIGTVTHKS